MFVTSVSGQLFDIPIAACVLCSMKDDKNSLSVSWLFSGTPRVAAAEKELETKQGILQDGVKKLMKGQAEST